ncbi:MAG: alpha-amylase family glycosyl hydrolase [Lachnospiraceae bacterium]|jgi:glycosidase|nr:alpha-amylase family glycosyl hydrolase [Lachnospiraceae bacterium]
MATDTGLSLRNQVMYCVFVRQYSKEGTFRKVTEDIPRIRSLGTDIVWLMPIHPIGIEGRKGSLGSPYAISDYRAVNPEYGTMEDFRELVDAIHAHGMKCIIDVVYKHTSPDSVLLKTHPEWFYHRADGTPGNRIGDWTDIVDLDYSKKGLWEYQIETLRNWARIVDGFRCDVASLVPLAFWLEARKKVAEVRPGAIWLAESVEPSFVCECRAGGISCLSDSELYNAFDITYDYDIYWDFVDCLSGATVSADATGAAVYGAAGRVGLSRYAQQIDRQEGIYPDNYVKLRLLENHDRMRAKQLIPETSALRNWTAFLFFQKGLTLIYNGQEMQDRIHPSLFDKDPVDWHTGEEDLSAFMSTLAALRKTPGIAEIFRSGSYHVEAAGEDALLAEYSLYSDRLHSGKAAEQDQGASTGNIVRLLGVFHTNAAKAPMKVSLADGIYTDLLTQRPYRVESGVLQTFGAPAVFRV